LAAFSSHKLIVKCLKKYSQSSVAATFFKV